MLLVEKHHSINGVNIHTQKALPKDYEKGQGGMGGGGQKGGQKVKALIEQGKKAAAEAAARASEKKAS